MNEYIDKILEQFYIYELNVSQVYSTFTHIFKEDSQFWWKLSLEEKNHAALVESIRMIFAPAGKLPSKIETIDLNIIKSENDKLNSIIKDLSKNILTRKGAFELALELENSAIEQYYQDFMSDDGGSQIDQMFRNLNNYDKDHADRISQYMKNHNI